MRFNVEGKAEQPSATTEADLLLMLRTFVTDRFKLQSHREQRSQMGFTMIVGRNGPKVAPVSCANPPSTRFGPGARVTSACVTMADFASAIQGMVGGPVTDKTGLAGKYDFTFDWPTEVPGGFLPEMQSRLGVRLEETKTPTEFLIIDLAEKPAL